MFKDLMTSRRFAPLFWSQFCSALNDNFLKNALGMLILFGISKEVVTVAHGNADILITLSGIVFIAPFIFLSALGGEIADKYDKAVVAERIKFYEIPVSLIAAAGFYFHSIPILFVALAGFGIIGALFGPVKYGILPEKLTMDELSAGNALVEGATFLAILLGTIAGGVVVAETKSPEIVVGILMALAVICWLSARAIPRDKPAAPEIKITLNPLRSTAHLLNEIRLDSKIWVGGQICSWFWLVGFVVMSLLPPFIKDHIGGTEGVVTLCLATFTIGVAVGSILAAIVSHERPNLSLVPIGALGMGIATLGLAFIFWSVGKPPVDLGPLEVIGAKRGMVLLPCLFLLAMAGGLYIVPAFAAVQAWARPGYKARVVAAVSVLNAVYMTGAGAVLAMLQAAGVGMGVVFALLGVMSIIAGVWVARLWSKEVVRDLGRLTFQTFYRLKVTGLENIPKAGERTIIAPNHVSLLEAPMLHTILPDHAAFAVNTEIAQKAWAKPFLQFVRHHTIDPTKPLAVRHLVNTVKSGETLVIFPEGRITTTSQLMKVYDGTAMIAEKADAWVVPVRVEGAERSPFSYLRPTQIKKAWFPKVSITFLPPVKLSVDADLRGRSRRQAAGSKLQRVMLDASVKTARIDRTLFEALGDAARTKSSAKVALQDPLGTKLTTKKLMVGTQVLGAKLEPFAPVGGSIGVMLPTSVGAAVTLFALFGIGRVPAMINFTAGPANIKAACKAAQVSTILTSRVFIEKGRMETLVAELAKTIRFIYLDDIRPTITTGDKLRALRAGRTARVTRLPNDPAVILFTSGSEGAPKGVVLSHRNILANVAQCLNRVDANGEDHVLNALPVFHSIGLTAGLVMPILGGIPVYLYPTPLHYRIIPEIVYDKRITIMFATDTFLNGYARTAHTYDMKWMRYIVAGAEAVKDRTRRIYSERFGVRILEGYGVTETAPVLALNTPISSKHGTVGQLSPGMEYRLEAVPGVEDGGRLFVKGPNVMLGYYRTENPGVLEPPPGGWHDTGDIVTVDADLFITIKGRAKRFAKIGGEMVSLSVPEAMAADLWPHLITVVTAEPDARRGERLVLLTTDKTVTREAFIRHAKTKGLAELTVPSEIMVVDKIPLLGSGKPDYMAAAKLVADRRAAHPLRVDEAAAV
jgi:acyl-[acyl-carrier-protein]-phospholipid O-acyltransferase / long-chain-fatty-acid--[acyl-carrier-protein] ligase